MKINLLKKTICTLLIITVTFSLSGCSSNIKAEKPTSSAHDSSSAKKDSDDKTSDKADSANVDEAVSKEFTDLCDEIFAYQSTLSTITLHYALMDPESYGIKRPEPTLGDISKEAYDNDNKISTDFKNRLSEIDKSKLSYDDQIMYESVERIIDLCLTTSDNYYLQEFLSSTDGSQLNIIILLAEYNFYNKQDVDDYLGLLKDIPRYFQDIMTFEKEKLDEGLFMSDTTLDAIVNQCEKFIEKTDDNLLVITFDERIDNVNLDGSFALTNEEISSYKDENKELVTKTVLPAYEDLIDSLEKLKGKSKNEGGMCNLEGGMDFYETMVKIQTGSDMSIDELKEATQDQMNKNLKAYSKAYLKVGSFNQDTITDPKEILDELKNEKISDDYPYLKDIDYEIKYLDKSLADYASPAFYLLPPYDCDTENCIYINSSSTTDDEIYTTLAHEGYPGHMYQSNYFRDKHPHFLRNLIGTSGYIEGWATYVEFSSYKYAYSDQALATTYENYMAFILGLYAYSDFSVNYYGFTCDDLYDYLSGNIAPSMEDVEKIYNYVIDSPGTYLNYYVGYMEISTMKDTLSSALGDDFSLLDFNTFILDMGPAPFATIKNRLYEKYGIDKSDEDGNNDNDKGGLNIGKFFDLFD